MTRNRTISSILGKETNDQSSRNSSHIRIQKRKKVPCYCNNCKGKLVLKRTKFIHDQKNTNGSDRDNSSENGENTQDNTLEIIEEVEEVEQLQVDDEYRASTSTSATLQGNIEIQSLQILTKNVDTGDDNTGHSFLPRKCTRRTNRPITNRRSLEIPEDEISEFTSRQNTESSFGDSETNTGQYSEIFENYCPPPYEDMDTEELSTDDNYLWILLWIMSFHTRFNIPETATESLLKFMKLVLNEIGSNSFKNFPDSFYLAKKALRLKDRFQSFVPCPKCHKLYNKQEVKNFRHNETLSIMKCSHIEFPNSSRQRLRSCNTPLSRQLDISTVQPELIFPFAGIRQQLTTMFRRQGFKNHLRHWSNRQQFNDILTDIYDNQV